MGEKLKTKRIREEWVLPLRKNNYSKLENFRKKYAAIKIQTWYRKHSQKNRKRYPVRNRKTPEIFRHATHLDDDIVLSATEQERELSEMESTETLDWDPESECTELYDELNEAFMAADLNLDFKPSCTNFMAVYDF